MLVVLIDNIVMANFLQQSFVGGLNRLLDPTKLQANEYPFLKNGRTRFDVVEPVKSPLLSNDNLPVGNIQGMYAAGNFLLVFIAGKAYYKDFSVNTSHFVLVEGFQMSVTAEKIYAELIPASTVYGIRKLVDSINGGVLLSTSNNGSPQCVVCQDGETQPWIIFPDGTARITQQYNAWHVDGIREYVPIGKQMMMLGSILYVVSPTGDQIYRSVSGRPLDFMVVIDKNGERLPNEADGGATNVSHKVSYDSVTCIRPLSVQDGSFYVSTSRYSYMVTPDYTITFYGEPTFKNTTLFDVGALNQFCVVDLLGDSGIITYSGIRSFNAVMQTKFQGKNAPFSSKIQFLFNNVNQTSPCAANFDDYAIFSVNTVYGQVLVIFDTVSQKYVGYDQYTGVATITQFADVTTNTSRKLFALTSDNKIYELFANTTSETCQLFIGEFCGDNASKEQKPYRLRAVFIDAKQDGTVIASPYLDRVKGGTFRNFVKGSVVSEEVPLIVPFGTALSDTVKVVSIDLGREAQGWKVGVLISWDFNAKLSHVQLECEDVVAANTMEEVARQQQSYSKGVLVIDSFTGRAPITERSVVIVRGKNFNAVVAIRIGTKYATTFIRNSDIQLTFAVPVGATTNYITLITAEYEVQSTELLTITT